jgi:hypothetical protein
MGDSPKYAAEHPISDAYLQELVDKLEADPADPSAQLYAQPGAFNARYTHPPPTGKSLFARGLTPVCAACPRWTSCSGFCAHTAPSAHPSLARVPVPFIRVCCVCRVVSCLWVSSAERGVWGWLRVVQVWAGWWWASCALTGWRH